MTQPTSITNKIFALIILLVVKLIYAEACLGFKLGKWDHLGQVTGQEAGLLVASGKTKTILSAVCVSGGVKYSRVWLCV